MVYDEEAMKGRDLEDTRCPSQCRIEAMYILFPGRLTFEPKGRPAESLR